MPPMTSVFKAFPSKASVFEWRSDRNPRVSSVPWRHDVAVLLKAHRTERPKAKGDNLGDILTSLAVSGLFHIFMTEVKVFEARHSHVRRDGHSERST